MIRFFPKSRRLLWIFGMVLGGCGGLIGWFLAMGESRDWAAGQR